MSERTIPERDLPQVSPAPTSHVRAVQGGKSVLIPMPEVTNAAALLAEAIEGIKDAAQAEAELILGGLGYLPPVAFGSGLDVDSTRFTVTYDGVTYAPVADEVPFTTTGTFDPVQWRVIQGVTAADLSLPSAAGMIGFKQVGFDAVTRTVADKLRDVVNVRDFGGSPDNPDNLAAFNKAFTVAHEVEYGDGEWLISGTLVIPAGRTLRGRKGGAVLKLRHDDLASTSVVRLENGAKAINCVFDGNLDTREANGFALYVFGAQIEDASRCVIDECHARGVGATDAFFNSNGGNGGGYLIISTETATQDTERNLIRNCTADSERSGFIARIASPFHGYAEGELPYAAKNNVIENISGEGCDKNAVELVGPNTWGNTVKDCHVYDITGQGGFEADFGAHHNRFERCTVEFRPGFVFNRTFDGFSQRSFDEGDGKVKISHDNSFIDCTMVGGETAGTYFLRGFSEIGASRGARWVRPKMRGFTRGSGVGNDRIIGHYQEATMVTFTGGVVEDPEFMDVDEAFRYAGSMGYTNFRIYRGYTQARKYTWRTINTSALNGSLKFRGGVHDCYDQHFSFAGELLVDADDVEFRGGVGSLAVVSGPTRPMSTIKFSNCDFTRVVAGSAPILSAQNRPCYIRTRDNTYGARAPGGLTDGTQGRVYNGGGDHVTETVLTAGRRVTAAARAYGTSAPTAGTWYRDDQVLRRDASSGASLGWRCTANGTFGTLSGITGTVNAGSDQLTVSAISTIVPGQYIAVAGSGSARHLVVDVAGNVVTISPAATNAVSGAAVTYANPVFEELSL